jgi:heme A synthase
MRYNTSSGGAPMPQPVPTIVISVLFSLTVISFWLWMFVEMIRNDDMDPTAKTYWTVGFIFLSIFAAGLYYLNIYRRRD